MNYECSYIWTGFIISPAYFDQIHPGSFNSGFSISSQPPLITPSNRFMRVLELFNHFNPIDFCCNVEMAEVDSWESGGFCYLRWTKCGILDCAVADPVVGTKN